MYQKITEKIKEEILNLSKENLNNNQIAEIVNMSPKMVSYHLNQLGVKSKNHGYILNKNHDFFEKIDSEIKAYLLGYFIADGCVSIEPKKNKKGEIYSYNKRMMLLVSVDDEEVIRYFQSYISPDTKIRYSNNQTGVIFRKPQCSIKISSKKIVEDLSKLNIHPRKTQDANFSFDFDLISKDLHNHFIRGFFDGDGGLVSKGKSIQFCFTSLNFCKQIEQLFQELNLSINISLKKGKNMVFYQLTINGGYSKIKIIKDYLYENANYYLKRKFDKFKIVNTVLNEGINKSSSV